MCKTKLKTIILSNDLIDDLTLSELKGFLSKNHDINTEHLIAIKPMYNSLGLLFKYKISGVRKEV